MNDKISQMQIGSMWDSGVVNTASKNAERTWALSSLYWVQLARHFVAPGNLCTDFFLCIAWTHCASQPRAMCAVRAAASVLGHIRIVSLSYIVIHDTYTNIKYTNTYMWCMYWRRPAAEGRTTDYLTWEL